MNQENLPDYDYFSTAFQPTLKGLFIFETKSFLGRMLQGGKAPKAKGDTNYLHLGCGKNHFDGWVNADFFGSLLKTAKKSHTGNYDWQLDIRFPFKCENNVWDGIFTEHTLEHLYPNEVMHCLKESYRTLKSGGWIRIVVPDVEKYIQNYQGNTPDPKFELWGTGCEAIRCLTQNFYHHSVWDGKFFKKVLEDVGFKNVSKVEFMKGSDPTLLKDMAERKWESLYMEAQK